jgi:4-hydroxy-3-polyprenylbenzoate decarboxylase
MPAKQPAELLTIANHILGTGQLSLAKFLFITADDTNRLHTHHVEEFLTYLLERIDLTRDVHFYTNTTIDTLDYSGTGLNTGSKVVFAAYGDPIRRLCTEVPSSLKNLSGFGPVHVCMPGVIALQTPAFQSHDETEKLIKSLNIQVGYDLDEGNALSDDLKNAPFIILCDDSKFTAQNLRNFLWVAFTRCNPSHDIFGIEEFTIHKHWGCRGPLIIDARIKPHHAPPVVKDPVIERKIDKFFSKGGVLHGID